jgi:four helix bundle protein
MPPRDLIERTRLFALAVVRFCRTLPRTDEARETAKHLRSSANSTRSNYRASRKGRSREEFQAKLQIAFEEADECVDCLEFLRDARIKSNAALLQEANEIAKILGASAKTARQNTARLRNLPKS